MYVASNGIISLVFIVLCVCVCEIFIYTSVDRNLGYFHVLAIVGSAAMNTWVYVFFSN